MQESVLFFDILSGIHRLDHRLVPRTVHLKPKPAALGMSQLNPILRRFKNSNLDGETAYCVYPYCRRATNSSVGT